MTWFLQVLASQIRYRLAYPGAFWISLALELGVLTSINWYLWDAIINARGGASFAGFSIKTMVLYTLITSILRKVQVGTDQFAGMGEDIYSGSLNKYLVYPVPYFGLRFAIYLGSSIFSFVQSFAALMIFWLAFAWQEVPMPNAQALLQFTLLVALAVSMRFLINSCLQILAFWFEQVWSLLVMVHFLVMLLGGQMLPMEMYPHWAREFLMLTPFPLLAAWPAEALLGKMSWPSFAQICLVAGFWLVLFYSIAKLSFARGVRHYSGIGA